MERVVLTEFFGVHHDDPFFFYRVRSVMRPVALALFASLPPDEGAVQDETLAPWALMGTIVRRLHFVQYRSFASPT